MAAALIPIFAGLAPELISLIVSLTHPAAKAAEAQLGTGSGPVKMATVFGDVMTALTKAAEAGTISKTLPPDETVKLILQAVVTSMKMSGALGSTPIAEAPSTSQIILLRAGQSLTINGSL